MLITANCASASRILNQTPISWALSATGRRVSQTNLWASNRISTQLFRRANRGANGKAATNIVMKPNCSTEKGIVTHTELLNFDITLNMIKTKKNKLNVFKI